MNHHRLFFNGYKRQLRELYCFLRSENYVSCDIDEFMIHFTGKKWDKAAGRNFKKLMWNKNEYLVVLLIRYLSEKNFFDYDYENINILKRHFDGLKDAVLIQYNANKKNSVSKRFEAKLNYLFPKNTGYRCKEREYYRLRNREPISVILKMCGIHFSPIS